MNAPIVTQDRPGQGAQDWDLVHRAQAGDMTAYEQLYERHRDTVMGFLRNRLEDRHLCEDLASETFRRALHRIDSVSYQGRPVGAWFVTIARNLLLDHLKSSRVRLERPWDDSPAVERLTERDRAVDPARAATTASLGDLLRAAMDQLGADQRDVLALRFLSDRSVTDTAEAMDRNVAATKALQHRACQRMRQLLHPSVVDYLRD